MKLLVFPNGNIDARQDAAAMARLYFTLAVVGCAAAWLVSIDLSVSLALAVGLGSALGGYRIAHGRSMNAPMRGLLWMVFGIGFVICSAFTLV